MGSTEIETNQAGPFGSLRPSLSPPALHTSPALFSPLGSASNGQFSSLLPGRGDLVPGGCWMAILRDYVKSTLPTAPCAGNPEGPARQWGGCHLGKRGTGWSSHSRATGLLGRARLRGAGSHGPRVPEAPRLPARRPRRQQHRQTGPWVPKLANEHEGDSFLNLYESNAASPSSHGYTHVCLIC